MGPSNINSSSELSLCTNFPYPLIFKSFPSIPKNVSVSNDKLASYYDLSVYIGINDTFRLVKFSISLS